VRVDTMRVLFLDVRSALTTRRYASVADPDALSDDPRLAPRAASRERRVGFV
jgi:hypothetical protein